MPTPESPVQQAAERVAGAAKRLAGEALGNDELVHEGELQKQKVDLRVQARRETERAELAQQQSRLQQRAHEAEAERARIRAEVQAERDELTVEAEACRAEQAVEAEKVQAEQAVDARELISEASADAQVEQAQQAEVAEQLVAARLRGEAARERARAEQIEEESA